MNRTSRRAITIEEVLRGRPSLGDLRIILLALREEVPQARRAIGTIVALTAAEVGAGIVVALSARVLIGRATDGAPGVAWAWVGIAAVAAVGSFAAARQRHLTQQRIVFACRQRAVDRLARRINGAPAEDLMAVPMAALREILMTDVDFAYRFGVDLVASTVVIGAWMAASVVVTAVLSPPLLAVLALAALVIGTVMARSVRRHLDLAGDRFAALADLSQRAREVVEVERVILARQLGLGERFVDTFLRAHHTYVDVSLAQERITATLRASLLGLNGVAFLITIVVGAAELSGGGLGVAELIVVLYVVSQLLVAVQQLGEFSYRAAETAKAGRRLLAYWDADPVRLDDGLVRRPQDRVEGVGLSFSYDGTHDVLQDASLTVRSDSVTTMTGASGAGKSTLALVLAGILQPGSGQVVVDGTGLEPGQRPDCLYIGSRPTLMEGSILDNLFRPTDRLDLAALEDLFGLLDGDPLDLAAPLIGPNGTGLSSGQAQLVGVARAWVRNPGFVIFDEATSALDMPSEARVQAALMEWCRRRVTLVISHRRCPWVDEADDRVTFGEVMHR
ncbi:ATP-binding cassette domain-containing protein [Euzebya tangerina]|uniref:ATP-binding cassette domain-containing protein n=1 Tax=Euzebya tangerina TaxID=591198 RepID=UPI000E313567|nr:ABC transporter ATP-binding protein [Euzebya tangerina]